MKNHKKINTLQITLIIFTLFFVSLNTYASEYVALDNLKEIKAVFDVRQKNIKTAALQLDLIHQTYHEQNIRNASEHPVFIVVFGGAAVKLLSSNREGYSDEEEMLLGLISDTIAPGGGQTA